MTRAARDHARLLLNFLRYLLPYRQRQIAILILGAIATGLSLANPYVSQLIVDRALTPRDTRLFVLLGAIAGGIFLLIGLINGLRDYVGRYVRARVGFDLHRTIIQHLVRLDMAYFHNTASGQHLYRIGYDIDRVCDFITTALPQAISLLPRLFGILAIVWHLNRSMAICSLCVVPVLYFPAFYFTKRLRRRLSDWIRHSEKAYQHLGDLLSKMLLVKALGRERAEARKHVRHQAEAVRMRLRQSALETTSSYVLSVTQRIATGLIAAYGGWQVLHNTMTLGQLTAVMIYFRQLVGLQGEFTHFFQQVAFGSVSCERLAEILTVKSCVAEKPGAKSVALTQGAITFRNVSFGYRKETPVLQSIDLAIPAGAHVAIVGHSGCGKTTILNLLLRLYDPWEGEITVDTHRIVDLTLLSLRSQMGVALQTPLLWNDTVANNIRYGAPHATNQEVETVARITGLDTVVDALPSGYATMIGENACRLSEGQKQRIAIARALIKQPRLLILDEAMSSIDQESERIILARLKAKYPNVTIITVSHRMGSVSAADSICFLRGPSELVVGTTDELLERDEAFRRLVNQTDRLEPALST